MRTWAQNTAQSVSKWAVTTLFAGASTLAATAFAASAAYADSKAVVLNDGYKLPVRMWSATANASEKVVIAVHGATQYSGDFDAFGRFMGQQGITTYAYDQRGFGQTHTHGEWAGAEQLASDLAEVVTAIQSQHSGAKVYVVGQGEGALVTLAGLGQENAPRVDGVVLMGPSLTQVETMGTFDSVMSDFWPSLKLSRYDHMFRKYRAGAIHDPNYSGHKVTDNAQWIQDWETDPVYIHYPTSGLKKGLAELGDLALDRARTVQSRLFIAYGLNNDDTDPLAVRRLVNDLRWQPRLAVYEQGHHLLHLDSIQDTMFGDVLSWMEQPIRLLPSGAGRDAWSRLIGTKYEGTQSAAAPYWGDE